MPAQSCTWRRSSSRLAWYPCIGCSASRLSKTRSGMVSSRFLAAGMARFPLPAPVPPLALLGREQRIAGLSYGRREDVLAADVDALAGDAAELLIKVGWVLIMRLSTCGSALLVLLNAVFGNSTSEDQR